MYVNKCYYIHLYQILINFVYISDQYETLLVCSLERFSSTQLQSGEHKSFFSFFSNSILDHKLSEKLTVETKEMFLSTLPSYFTKSATNQTIVSLAIKVVKRSLCQLPANSCVLGVAQKLIKSACSEY